MTSAEYSHAGLRFKISDAGHGHVMLFQHGLCGDAAQTLDVFPTSTDWRCLTLECRGHGGSQPGPPEQFSIATFTEDVASFLVAQKLGPVVIGGISMGAAIAMRLAVTHPHLVSALVLARPAWLTADAPLNMQPNAFVGDLLGRFAPSDALARFERSEIATRLQAQAPDNLTSLRGFFARQPISVTRELLCRISADGPGVTAADLAKISVPTLVLGSAADFVHPIELARSLAALIPAARLVEITPKSISRAGYKTSFQSALSAFLEDIVP